MSSCIRPTERARSGFTLIEMMIVILVITILLMIAIPSVTRARSSAREKTCQTNLWHIREAKQRWAMENRKVASDTPNKDDLCPTYMKLWPECPESGEYVIGDVDSTPTCSLGGEHAIE